MANDAMDTNNQQSLGSTEYQLKKYLLLLATLVATVTYAAGLNPPGGSWLEDSPSPGGRRIAGDSILREINFRRYIVFYCFNAIAFAASLLLSLLLLFLHKDGGNTNLLLMLAVMLVDGLGLTGAYAAGGSHDRFTTVCAAVLVSGVSLYAVVAFLTYFARHPPGRAAARPPAAGKLGKKHEILLVLAIFTATNAYVAGLNPPGGFWRSTEEGHRAAGDPVLQGAHPRRYKAFFFCNTAAFAASLLAITLIMDYEKLDLEGKIIKPGVAALYGLIVTALLGLGGAYAAGSCRDSKHSAQVLLLLLPVAASIFLQQALVLVHGRMTTKKLLPCIGSTEKGTQGCCGSLIAWMGGMSEDLKRTREYIQLLATLVATIAYQAGLDPPGGVWAGDGDGHRVGDPILLTTHPGRFKVFFYFNSAAFVASIVIVIMLQNEHLVRGHALEMAMILDFFGLIGAYAAGSCRDTITSIYTVALVGGVLIYVVIHIVFLTLDDRSEDTSERKDKYKSHREVLLLLAILAATLTYQGGLTPPGGFWEEDDGKLGHRAGFPVLQDKYPRRYEAFFYCNAASFMASVALIVLLLNPNLYRPGIRCYALYVCMVAGVLGLLGAYAAGSSLHLHTSNIFLVLAAAGFAIVLVLAIHVTTTSNSGNPPLPSPPNNGAEENQVPIIRTTTTSNEAPEPNSGDPPLPSPPNNGAEEETAMYLMLVGILAASVTYLTGLKPPGGMWRSNGNGHSAGNPVLYDTNKSRYNVFFYSNSISFVASVVAIALLLLRMMLSPATEKTTNREHDPADKNKEDPAAKKQLFGRLLGPIHAVVVLDMLFLLVAYAAGSIRESRRSWEVIVLFPAVVLVVFVFFFMYRKQTEDGGEKGNAEDHSSTTTIILLQASA